MRTLASGVELDGRAVDELATSFGGALIRPDDATYDDERRIWNGSIDRRPALIAQCAGVADVISAVRFAREQEQLVAVRSGRHSYPGLGVCDGGMVIDLGRMKGIRVDPKRAPRGPRPGSCSATWIARRRRSGSPCPPGS